MKRLFKSLIGVAMGAAVAVAGAAGAAWAEGEKYVLVSHAPDSDSRWNTIKNGIALAGEQMGVEVEYRNPPTGDIADMAREVGAPMYVGQPECDAGHAAGLRAKGDGVTSFLCVNHSTQQPTLAQRCQGLADGLGIETGAAMLDGGADPAEIKNEVLAYPFANPNTDAILTLDETGMAGDIRFGAFRSRRGNREGRRYGVD